MWRAGSNRRSRAVVKRDAEECFASVEVQLSAAFDRACCVPSSNPQLSSVASLDHTLLSGYPSSLTVNRKLLSINRR